MVPAKLQPKCGVTLIELLCVVSIIAVLLAIYLGAIARAFLHVKRVLGVH
jgi:prepilin-type N-terminal cleavage/methylation domain-containing protein